MRTIFSLLMTAALLATAPIHADLGEDLLDADEAFRLELKAKDAETLMAKWTIADGYYMYRDKVRFQSNTDGITLGEPEIPSGEIKNDPTFGEVAIFHGEVVVEVPVKADAEAPEVANITAFSQGCAEDRVCYPPHRQTRDVVLLAGAPAAPTRSLRSFFGLGGQQEEILNAEEAFRFDVEVIDPYTALARWQIATGYYLYRDKFEFEVLDPEGVQLGDVVLPPGETKEDPTFGNVQIFHDAVEAKVPFVRQESGATDVTLKVTYQGCAEQGLCYPPERKEVVLALPIGGSAAALSTAAAPLATAAAGEPGDEVERFTRALQASSLGMVVVWALLAGLGLAFTACMYPMIPIVSGIIVGQGQNITAGKGFTLSLVYVGAMALTFGAIGATMALFGGGIGIQAYAQSPWLLIPFAVLFVVLALGMFGLFNIQIPSAIQSRLNALSSQQQGGTFIGVGLMGTMSALIIGPCGGPILIAALAFAASAGNVVKGFLLLFMLGLGMGLPLLLVGVGGGKLLPKAGGWMNAVKATAGVVLLGVGILMLERMPSLFPPGLTMMLWSALLIISAIFLGALSPLPEVVNGWRRLWKGLGVVFLLYGFLVMLGGLTGASNVLDPLHGSALVEARGSGVTAGADSSASITSQSIEFRKVKTVEDVQRETAAATATGKVVMLDFYADWCTYCKQFEAYVFNDPGVRQALGKLVLLKADVTATDEQDKRLMKSYNVFLPPAILFLGQDGSELRGSRIVGFMEAEAFRAHVERVQQL